MKNQAYRMAMLFDFYGDLLTDRQKEFFDLYYNEDLSLAEIGENYGITRQGVRDVIVRGEAYMETVEEKTGLIKRFHTMRSQLEELSSCADAILKRNAETSDDPELETMGHKLKDLVETMKQE